MYDNARERPSPVRPALLFVAVIAVMSAYQVKNTLADLSPEYQIGSEKRIAKTRLQIGQGATGQGSSGAIVAPPAKSWKRANVAQNIAPGPPHP